MIHGYKNGGEAQKKTNTKETRTLPRQKDLSMKQSASTRQLRGDCR